MEREDYALNSVITELWEEYKKAVITYGYGTPQVKEILVKIFSLAPKK
ncbi:hypothetical protein [Paenibacillus anseongense]|nr:hypothetical protein [Paenibacillus anseongense]MEC0265152.1 hypothetical protein [Paenibacillus anseongense]